MPAVPSATVVVVARDRWSQAPATLDLLLARTDRRHPVVVVDGRAPRPVALALDRAAASGRINVARRDRHLAANEARNVGADGFRTEWVAFVENDAVPSDGWLDALLAVGEARGAASTYPAFLLEGADAPIVHGLGADLEVTGAAGARRLRERQHHLNRPWHEVAPGLEAVERVQSELHTVAIRRDLLDDMGGLDEGLLSWFDHTDLALHHQRLGAAAWFVPEVTCTYLAPPPVSLSDLPNFMLRWSEDWYRRSLDHLCAAWGLDADDAGWEAHARYRASVRQSVLTPWRRVNAAIERAVAPVERLIERRDARQRTSHVGSPAKKQRDQPSAEPG
ncbi:MAG: glycosyltransferase [Actinomycetota bacterium]|nr:glycosyltransferase [Actinomycetota bacterium]